MGAAFSGQHRQQGEYTGIAGGAEREWRQRTRAPAKRTDDMTEPANRVERRIEGCAADGIENDVEAAPPLYWAT
jgi:hypothetical protein